MLRTIAERLSREVVVQRRLPRDFGSRRYYVSPDAALRFWNPLKRDFDHMLFDFARHFVREGDVVIDAGANVGLLAFAAAQRAGSSGYVIAIDADDWITALLRRSSQLRGSGEAEVQVISAALSREPGIASFSIAARGRAANFLTELGGSSQSGGSRDVRLVVTTTLDIVASHTRRPNVLKIDLEQAELLALQGATEVLSRDRPVMLCEIDSQWAAQVGALLSDHSYALFDAEANYRPTELPTFNTVACPTERLTQFPVLQPRS
jgi:FkbM family methyltransferase